MSLQICGWNQTIFLSWWKLTEIITLLFKTLAELQISAIKNQLKIIRKVISVQWRFPIASTLTEQLIHRSLLFWQLILRYRIQGNIRPLYIYILILIRFAKYIGWVGRFYFSFFLIYLPVFYCPCSWNNICSIKANMSTSTNLNSFNSILL